VVIGEVEMGLGEIILALVLVGVPVGLFVIVVGSGTAIGVWVAKVMRGDKR
jgi:hypothetical protein